MNLKSRFKIYFSGIKEHRCPKEDCDKSFRSTSQLNDHIKGHEQGFICNICNRSFKSRTGLKNHKSIHNRITAEQKCEQCDKTFNSVKALKMHGKCHISKTFATKDKICIGEQIENTKVLTLETVEEVTSKNKHISCKKVFYKIYLFKLNLHGSRVLNFERLL